LLCQLCGVANPDDLENCRNCGHKLLVVSGVTRTDLDPDDDDLLEAQEQLDEHLLERITSLEEAMRKIGVAALSLKMPPPWLLALFWLKVQLANVGLLATSA